MNWFSFLSMGGDYASYIWSAYGICLAVLLLTYVYVRRKNRQLLKRLRHQNRAQK